MDMLSTLIVVILYAYAQIHQNAYIKDVQFMYINYTLISLKFF